MKIYNWKWTIIFILINVFGGIAYSQDFQWAKNMGGTGEDEAKDLVVDANGNIYSTGFFFFTADFDPGPGIYNLTSSGFNDIFISKLDSSGNFIWALNIGGLGDENEGRSITIDSFNNVYLTGLFSGTADFDPGIGVFELTSAGNNDIFILKLDSSGNFLWAARFGGSAYDKGLDITIDNSGNILSTGQFWQTVDFDPGPDVTNLVSFGSHDIYIIKLTQEGDLIWAKNFGGIDDDIGQSITTDNSNNIYIAGYFKGTSDFDPGAGEYNLTSAGNNDIVITKLDSYGNFIWSKCMGGNDLDWVKSIAVNENEEVFTTGSFKGVCDFNPDTSVFNLTSLGDFDIFVSKLNADGSFAWTKSMGSESEDEGYSIKLDINGDVYTSGYFRLTVDFDPGVEIFNLVCPGGYDVFISKLNNDGNFVSAINIGGTKLTIANALFIDDPGNIYITGMFDWTTDFDPDTSDYNITATGGYDIFISKLNNCILKINSNPLDQYVMEEENVLFNISVTDPTAAFQWQENAGFGFIDLLDMGQYSGSTNDTLFISAVSILQNNFYYRCVATSKLCIDTSEYALLNVFNNVAIEDMNLFYYSISPNPNSGSFTISANVQTQDFASPESTIEIYNTLGQLMYSKNINTSSGTINETIQLQTPSPGIYLVNLKHQQNIFINKIVIE